MKRTAFSLLEVIIATAILLGCVIVLAELAGIGRQSAVSAEDLCTAQFLCQAKLNELRAGAVPLLEVQAEPLLEAPEWVYTIHIEPLAQTGLVVVQVTVAQDDTHPRPRSFSLVQWLRSRNYDFNQEETPDADGQQGKPAPEGEGVQP